jgi:hypothetical protein
MYSRSKAHPGIHYVTILAVAIALAMIAVWLASSSTASSATPSQTGIFPASETPISNLNFNFQPSTVSLGSQVTVSVTFSGGTPGFYLWFNSTPAGCSPQGNPQTTSSDSYSINCRPTSAGVFTAHLDVLDSASPPSKVSMTATLTVTSNGNNNNNNNGSGNNSNNNNNNGNGSGGGSFSLPSGLLSIALIGGIAFLGALVAIAAGTIATAVVVSRRLRQLNETLQKLIPSTDKPKPPT